MSAPQCEWSGEKNVKCEHGAEWQHVTPDRHHHPKVWKLCDGHKRMLLASYGPEWRSKEDPEWTRITQTV